MKVFNPVTLFLILCGAVMLGIVLWQEKDHRPEPVESLVTFQTADAALMLPADGRPRHGLHPFSAWELVSVPIAPRFDAPMGTASGGLTYNAQKFWEMNDARGGHHTGDDLNGIGGMNTDLGDPVYAVADGRVVFAGESSPGWGKIVVLAHRTEDGRLLQSMYAHLHRIDVPIGALVSRGRQLGQVGTANGNYPAHLHFEMRESDGVDIGAGYGSQPLNRLDPAATLAALRGAAPDAPAPSMLRAALEKDTAWNRIELSPEDAARLSELPTE